MTIYVKHSKFTVSHTILKSTCVEVNMANTVSLKNNKASTDKSISGKLLTGDKNLGVDPDICFYELEYVNNTKEG